MFNVYDGSGYWVVTDRETSADGAESFSSYIDDDAAVEAAPVKTFNLQYQER